MAVGESSTPQTHGRKKKRKHQYDLADMEPISKKQNNQENIDIEKTYRKALKAEKKKEDAKHATLLKETNYVESQIGKSKGQEFTKKKKNKVRRKEEVIGYKDEAENDKNGAHVETRKLQSHIDQPIKEISKKKKKREDKRKEEFSKSSHKEKKAEKKQKKEKVIQSEESYKEKKKKKRKEEVFVESKQEEKRKKEEIAECTQVESQEVENRKKKHKKKKKKENKAEGEHQTTKEKKKKHKKKKHSSDSEETIFYHSTETECTQGKKRKKTNNVEKDRPISGYEYINPNNTVEVAEETGKIKKKKLGKAKNGIEMDKTNNIIIDLTSHEDEQIIMKENAEVKKRKKSKTDPVHEKPNSNSPTVETRKSKKRKSAEKTNVIEKHEANIIIDLTSLDSEEEQKSMQEKTELKKQKNRKKKKSVNENEKELCLRTSPLKTTKPQEYERENAKKRKLVNCDGYISDSQHKKKKKRKDLDGFESGNVKQKKKKTKSIESDENNINVVNVVNVDSPLKEKKKKKAKESQRSNTFSYDTHHDSIDSTIISSSTEQEETEEEHSTHEHHNISSDNEEDVNSDSEKSMFNKYLSYEEQAKRRDRYGRLLTNTVTPAGRKKKTDTSLHQHLVISPGDEVKFDDLSTCCDYVKSMPWQDSPNAEKLHKLAYRQLYKADIEKLAMEGIIVKRGRWLREEEHRLQMNFKAFLKAHKTLLLDVETDDLLVCGQDTEDGKKWQLIQDVRKNHNFVTSLSLGLERDIYTVRRKAIDILHTSYEKHFTPEEDKHLLELLTKYGSNKPSKIAAILGRTPKQVNLRIRWITKSVNKGKWTEAECQTLRQVVQKVHEESGRDPMQEGSYFPWINVSALIPSRNHTQCKNKWRRIGHLGTNEEFNRQVNARLRVALVEYLENLVSTKTEPLDDRAINWTQVAKDIGFPNRDLCYRVWFNAKYNVARHEEDISVQGVLERLGPLTEKWKKTAGLHELITIPGDKEPSSEPWHYSAVHQVITEDTGNAATYSHQSTQPITVDKHSHKKADSGNRESSKEMISIDSSSDSDDSF